MSVRQYYNKYRASFSLNGRKMQLYFSTEKEALDMCKAAQRANKMTRPAWAKKTKKKKDAKAQDLPVGFLETFDRQINANLEEVKRRYIKAVFVKKDGKLKHMCRAFTYEKNHPTSRTREQAILLLTEAVLKFIQDEG